MRLKAVLFFPLSLCLFVSIQTATTASSSKDQCALPPDLRDEISKTYPSLGG